VTMRVSAPRAVVAVEPLRVVERGQALVPAALSACALTAIGAAGGGYFPASWGWSALAFAWVAGLALALRQSVRLSRAELLFLGGVSLVGVWTLASALWAEAAGLPVREAERTAVYVTAALAALLVTSTRLYRGLLGGAWAAITLAALYALATRLLPDRYGEFDSLGDYRLGEPVGYWNGLGILTVIGAVLALGIAARARSTLLRSLAGASTVVLVAALYFTFSRGAWIALGVGLLTAIALDPRRLQLSTTLLVLTPAPALGVLLASQSEALIRRGSTFEDATTEGHRLAIVLLVLAALGGAAAAGLAGLEGRLRPPRSFRLGYGAALLLVAAALLTGALVEYGGPVAIVERGYGAFTDPTPPGSAANPHERLLSLASPARSKQWRVAWEQYKDHSLLGSGAGSYERFWLRDRPDGGVVRDAHSLYLETLAELGPVGLALLVGTLAVPLVVAVRARRRALVPAAAGAYAAYLVHAGVDWDWELPAVTVAALLCAAGILVAARGPSAYRISARGRAALLAGTALLGAFAFVGLMGNQAVAASKNAEEAERLRVAESEARSATRWAPWSAESWQALARVHFERNDLPRARAALLEALERDRGDWAIWYDLGVASTGRAQQRAYEEAARLNPRSRNVEVLRIVGVLPPR
jgi:O-Antigen ligase